MEAFYDKFINILSDFHSISKPDATKLLDNCIKQVAINSGIDSETVRLKFATSDFFKNCLYKLIPHR